MEIKDLQGKVIVVTDLPQSIAMVSEFLSYRFEQRERSLIAFEHQRQTYWRDVFQQLIMLQYHNSNEPHKVLPEFISEGSGGAWKCNCHNSEGFYSCDSKGNEIEPQLDKGWNGLYACTHCRRIIDGDTLQVVGHKE